MLSLKMVRSLVFGYASSALHHHQLPSSHDDSILSHLSSHRSTDNKHHPVLVFLPIRQLVTHTYALTNLARSLDIDIHPDPSLSRIVFAFPSFLSSSASSTTSTPSLSSFNFPPPSMSPPSFSFSFSFSSASMTASPSPSLTSPWLPIAAAVLCRHLKGVLQYRPPGFWECSFEDSTVCAPHDR